MRQADNSSIAVSANALSELQYVGGSSAGSETIDICAYDTAIWSQWQIATYNGDGTSDILFRDPACGALTAFFMHNNVPTWAAIGSTGTTWHVSG